MLYIIFTFHYVSIKTSWISSSRKGEHNLHSTMYLLKLSSSVSSYIKMSLFTFHYVSIKTMMSLTMKTEHFYLHSTMYLLKLLLCCTSLFCSIFTFHYVSIKTYKILKILPCTDIYIPLCIY